MQDYRTNQRIRTPEVRVIDDKGNQLGVMPIEKALQEAQSRELDLVEVSPVAKPPVCRIMDYGKFCYQQSKRESESKKASKSQKKEKEIKLKPQIDKGDFTFKVNQAKGFLEKGHPVRVTCQLRGRMIERPEVAKKLVQSFTDSLSDVSKPEAPLQMRSPRLCTILLKPAKSKSAKPVVPDQKEEAPEEGE